VNDIAVLGAEPLFFLDYLGTGRLEPHVFKEIIKGFVRGCAKNNCALVGGETAQMPGFYQPGEYDVSGTIVGVVEKSRMLDGQKNVKRGDVILGIESSGLHTNGYSLGRKIFFDQMKLKPTSRVAELGGTIGEALLATHVTYGPLVQKLVRKFNPVGRASSPGKSALRTRANNTNSPGEDARPTVKAFAHITGGGFVDNIPRVLPPKLDAVVYKGTWDMLPIFQIIREKGGVDEAELYQVFNMGIGMVAIVSPEQTESVLNLIRAEKHKVWIIGEITKGSGVCRVE
jgi:phosphoribosylformylglycinamidine cyclo-ligase